MLTLGSLYERKNTLHYLKLRIWQGITLQQRSTIIAVNTLAKWGWKHLVFTAPPEPFLCAWLIEYRSEKTALIADYETFFFSKFKSRYTFFIFEGFNAIRLIFRKAWKGKQSESYIVSTLRRQKIAVMLTTKFSY